MVETKKWLYLIGFFFLCCLIRSIWTPPWALEYGMDSRGYKNMTSIEPNLVPGKEPIEYSTYTGDYNPSAHYGWSKDTSTFNDQDYE